MPLIIPKSVIGGSPVNVTDLLKTDHIIPAYQRDYVWQEKTVKQLWDDLVEHFNRNSVAEQLPDPEGYFLGAMVVIEHAEGQPLEIVDGQQRVTTLCTMASVLYDAIQILDPMNPSKTGLEARLLEMLGKFDGVNWKPNLSFTDADLQKFFLESCLTKRSLGDKQAYWNEPWPKQCLARKRSPISRVQQAIECGYTALSSFLAKQSDPHLCATRLVSFVRLATEAVVVLKITAKSHSNAYSIFESLNNRGVPLSQADLIKNELLKIAPAGDRDDIVDNWTNVRQTVDTFESVQLPDLIHYSYLSRHGRAKAKELYTVARKRVEGMPGNAKTYSEELVEDAGALDAVSENFKAGWTTETVNMLKDIKSVLGVKLCYPFLVAAYRAYAADPTKFEGHVRAVMNFAFRYMKVLEGSVDALAGIISDTSLMVNNGRPLSDIRDEFRKHAPDAEFTSEFESISFQSTKLAYFAVYYLEKVQVLGVIPVSHGDDQNLEHIMPKTPNAAQWPIALAQKMANPDTFKDYLWRVGNLLPLPATINKSIKNREISHKIHNASSNHYNAPGLGLESPKKVAGFLDGGNWTFKSIDDRQKQLADTFAKQAWML